MSDVTISAEHFSYLMALARFAVEKCVPEHAKAFRTRHLDVIQKEAERS